MENTSIRILKIMLKLDNCMSQRHFYKVSNMKKNNIKNRTIRP